MNFKSFDTYWKEISEKASWSIISEMVLHKSKCFGVTPWETVVSIFERNDLIENIPEEVKEEIARKKIRKYRKRQAFAIISFGLIGVSIILIGTNQKIGEPQSEKQELRLHNIKINRKLVHQQKLLDQKEQMIRAMQNSNRRWKTKYEMAQEEKIHLSEKLAVFTQDVHQLEKSKIKVRSLEGEISKILVDLKDTKKELQHTRTLLQDRGKELKRASDGPQFVQKRSDYKPIVDAAEVKAIKKRLIELRVKLINAEENYEDKMASSHSQLEKLKLDLTQAKRMSEDANQERVRVNDEFVSCSSENRHLNSRIDNLTRLLDSQRLDLTNKLQEEKLRIELDEELINSSFYQLSKKYYEISNKYMNLVESIKPVHSLLSSLSSDIGISDFKKSVSEKDWPRVASNSQDLAQFFDEIDLPIMKLEKILRKFSNKDKDQLALNSWSQH